MAAARYGLTGSAGFLTVTLTVKEEFEEGRAGIVALILVAETTVTCGDFTVPNDTTALAAKWPPWMTTVAPPLAGPREDPSEVTTGTWLAGSTAPIAQPTVWVPLSPR